MYDIPILLAGHAIIRTKSVGTQLRIIVANPTAATYFVSTIKKSMTINFADRDGVVGTATRYGLDGPGIESRWG